jgi:pimeloyl-ACP methyl ester carboxylesterase
MGSGLSMNTLLTRPERVKSIILGGYGADPTAAPSAEAEVERRRARVDALLADNPEQITDPELKAYRLRVEGRGGDLKTLAAVQMGNMENPVAKVIDPATRLERIKAISVPLMTVLGSDDGPPGDKSRLAMLVAEGCHFQISGRDHLATVPDPRFHMAVRGFLTYVNSQ